MKTQHVAVGDSYMNVAIKGKGKPILLVHGFPLDHSMWRFQFNEFAKHHRVICPDLAGFGASPTSTIQMTMKSFADDLAGLLVALKVSQPVVYCGLSMGGYIGWQFWKHHSDKLSHLVACDTRAAADSREVARARRIASQSVRHTGSRPVADAMIEKLFYQAKESAKKPISEPVHQVMSRTLPESIASGQLAMADRPDATSWLAEIKIPTLFVVGEHDEITPPAEMRDNAQAAAGSEFLEIHDAGHMAPLENPDEFNRGLISFLDRN